MIEHTVPLLEMAHGMARCVREWILPHLDDPLARLQAEQLAGLLEALPQVVSPRALAMIRLDSEEARDMLARLGGALPPPAASGDPVEDFMRENAALKTELERLAASWRDSPEPAAQTRLVELQRFLMRSLTREFGGAVGDSGDVFASMTAKEHAARKG